MNASFTAATTFTKGEEGGYTTDPRDSGNWSSGVCGQGTLIGSNMGVGAPALCSWLGTTPTPAYMKALPVATYNAIATARYWRCMGCDQLPAGIDLSVFDSGWNRGDGSAVRLLQELVGVEIDGDCGPMTVQAVAGYGDMEALLDELAAAQEADYRNLKQFNIYGDGWIARTEARLTAALNLAQAAEQAINT